ncbi:UPF0182 family membrane protein [Jatrophihabitans sp. YIM 134969]
MRPPMPSMRLSRRSKILLGVIGALVVLLILGSSLSGYYLDYEWFGEVGQRGVFTSVLVTRLVLFAVFGVIMAAIIGVNVVVAYRLRPPFRPMSPEQQNLERYRNRIEPRRGLLLGVLLALFGIITGLSMQGGWQGWTLWLNGVSFGQKDPQFGLDVSFYVFNLPVYRTLLGFGFTAIIFAFLLSLVVHYIFGAVRLQTPGPKMTLAARRHLTVLVFVFVVLKAIAYWLDRYELVFSSRGQGFNGASYTDVNAALPAKTILFWVAIVIALAVLASMWLRSVLIPTTAFVVLLVLAVLANGIYPAVVQQFKAKPNANVLESTYIARNIAATRQAYDIVDSAQGGGVTYQNYNVTGTPDVGSLTTDNPTIENIRVLDPNILSPTFNQLQYIQNFYGFPDKLDIDRYDVDDTTKDYIVSARELKAQNLTGDQLNWINQHTRYTHGYGFVAAAANNAAATTSGTFDAGNIPQTGAGFPLSQPRIYFGEDMVDYSLVGARLPTPAEYDGSEGSFTYDGKGGVSLSSLFNRLAFATHYRELSFLLNDVATAPGARVIFDRDPRERVQKVAPFLKIDGDPYPVVVDNKVVWMVDGYTTTANFPYAQRGSLADLTSDTLTVNNRSAVLPDDQVNYIRNSVKATVDAYDGTVTLYQWDEKDPILKAWMKAFPGLVQPKSKLTDQTDLVSHVRYPEDLFNAQRSMLQKYHVDDPSTFYSSTAQWTTPSDPTSTATNKPFQPPYYVQASNAENPDVTSGDSTFQLTSPMNVQKSENLAAYVSVDSTYGDDYGKMTVLQVPKSPSISGPERAFTTSTGRAEVSQDIRLLEGNRNTVLYGNVLTLPIGGSFLYVIPVYTVGSNEGSYPILRRVLLSYGSAIGYEPTLTQALQGLQQGFVGRFLDTNNQTGGGTVTPTSPGSTSSPTGSTSAPTTGSNGSVDQQLQALRQQIADLAYQINVAQRAGDYTKAGELQGRLAELASQYGSLSASASPSTGTPSTGAASAGSSPPATPTG